MICKRRKRKSEGIKINENCFKRSQKKKKRNRQKLGGEISENWRIIIMRICERLKKRRKENSKGRRKEVKE